MVVYLLAKRCCLFAVEVSVMTILYCPGKVATETDGTIKCSQPVVAMTSQEIRQELGYASAMTQQDYEVFSNFALLMLVIAWGTRQLISIVKRS